ncbi:hypothetical protein GCM10020331_076050 [Ectobacillus funiculus]
MQRQEIEQRLELLIDNRVNLKDPDEKNGPFLLLMTAKIDNKKSFNYWESTTLGESLNFFYKQIPMAPTPYGQSMAILCLVEYFDHNISF